MLINGFLLLGAALFAMGIYGLLARRNAVLILLSVELMKNAGPTNTGTGMIFHYWWKYGPMVRYPLNRYGKFAVKSVISILFCIVWTGP